MRKFLLILSFVLILPISFAHAADKAEGEDASDAPVFQEIEQIVIPIIKKNGRTGVLTLSLIAEVADEEEREEVRAYMPRLKDAYIRSLYGDTIAKKLTNEDGVVDIIAMKDRLIKTSNYVLKDVKIKDLLFDKMAQHTF